MSTKIERKDQFTFIVDGNELTIAEFVKQHCPSKEFVEWYENSAGNFLVRQYTYENIDNLMYGWEHLFKLYGLKGDYKVMEDWDSEYHVLLY